MEEGRALSGLTRTLGPRAGQLDHEEATLGLGDHGPASGLPVKVRLADVLLEGQGR